MQKSKEVFYKICFDSLLEGICIANHEGRIVMNNSAVEELFGYEKGELTGKEITQLIPEAQRKIHLEYFQNFIKHPRKYKKGKGREFLGLHKNGQVLDLEIGLNYFRHEGKFYAKALISEISIRKRKELRIKEKNKNLELVVEEREDQLIGLVSELELSNRKLKEEIKERVFAEQRAKLAFEKEKELNILQTKFISLASHEFKTPLSGIMTSASLIQKYNEVQSNPRIAKHTNTIKSLVGQLNNILDDFLFLENSERKGYPMHLSRFRLSDLINKLVEDATALLKEGQNIKISPFDPSTELQHDRKVIDIIIRNVLFNAIKYSSRNSTVSIKICTQNDLKLVIEDQGIGIPNEAKEYIFDRFYRAKNALPIQGTGIGLNIVKRHLQRINGSIDVESEEKIGTKVSIDLPLSIED
ncbi:PAS domain-containing sensor histidine kinase [Lutimonas zeaxanthinifaciens]|uniref:PAS domain-containing sensor histidine kinase n=1 Tax=Lutimonas zeaxanthinifaciens TaxID=3060215 RepID=UPI00265CE15A|nr:PAS domain-containing sensor histidine kinase [Lutimonas sp. YSD2104]WKK66205.1 PAS domain-containing sensor histidine kinase [Lutimonas sp. YSD2104]